MNDFLALNILVLLGSLVALAGGLIFLGVKPLASFLRRYAGSFAAGVLLTVALIGLIPESAHQLGDQAYLTVLLAFLATYLFENFLFDLHHHEDNHHHAHQHHSSVPLIIFGDTIHNLIDGAAIAAAYLASPALGLTTAISTFLHEIPHEMADFGVLVQAGWRRKKVILTNVLSSLSAFLGAYLVWFSAEALSITGYLLAISGGIFLYLAASDFLPKPSKEIEYKKAVLVMAAGVVVMLAALKAVPHSHETIDSNQEHTQEIH